MAAGLADRRIRQDLVKYCRTKFDKADLIRATNRLADFDGDVLVLWSRNPVMPEGKLFCIGRAAGRPNRKPETLPASH